MDRKGMVPVRSSVTKPGLLEPPFYQPEFEDAFRFIVDEYDLRARELAIFIPCAVRKPYSSSPSHRLFARIFAEVLPLERYQLLIFGTCGVVPAELERMYPFAHYHYILGNVHDERIRRDFLEIETYRLTRFLIRSRDLYGCRCAYCIGIFRDALLRAVERSGVSIDLLLPSDPVIRQVYDPDCPFPEGSLSRAEYIDELRQGLRRLVEERP
jgi:archaeosine synthase